MKYCLVCKKILSKHQKVYCSPKCQCQGSKYTIETCQEVASKRGGQCLSIEYQNSRTYMRWRCKNDHEWEAPFGGILAGRWCEECVRTKWTTEKMHVYIGKLGGHCSDEYVNMKTKIKAICPKGHECRTTFDYITQNERIPCNTCKLRKIGDSHRKWSEDYVKTYIINKGGKLESQYTRVDEPITILCAYFHAWTTTFDKIHNEGTWCPKCAPNRLLYIDDAARIGKQRGLTLLSKEYVRSQDNLEWKCQDNHIFQARLNSINRGSGCPYCFSGVKEAKCRFIFEESFKVKFPQTRKALKNHYQLDGYNDQLRIAFEYQGEQHYQIAWYHEKCPDKFHKLQAIDQEKRLLSHKLGITLIEIPYWESKTDEQLKSFINSECNRLGIKPSTRPIDVQLVDFKGRPSKLDEIRNIVEQDSGKVLTASYVSMKDKTITVECKYGHVQQQSPSAIMYAAKRGRGYCYLCRNTKVSEKRKGMVFSEEHKQNIRVARGKPETLAKASCSLKLAWQRRGRFDYDKMKKAYADGNSISDMAKEFRCSVGTVYRALNYQE